MTNFGDEPGHKRMTLLEKLHRKLGSGPTTAAGPPELESYPPTRPTATPTPHEGYVMQAVGEPEQHGDLRARSTTKGDLERVLPRLAEADDMIYAMSGSSPAPPTPTDLVTLGQAERLALAAERQADACERIAALLAQALPPRGT